MQILYAIQHVASTNTINFQQQPNGAPAHRAKAIIQLLQRDTTDCIAPDLWPPNILDLKLVNYDIGEWPAVCETCVH